MFMFGTHTAKQVLTMDMHPWHIWYRAKKIQQLIGWDYLLKRFFNEKDKAFISNLRSTPLCHKKLARIRNYL